MDNTINSLVLPQEWVCQDQKTVLQSFYDLVGAPLRMVLLPDTVSEKLHLTSLRGERFRKVLPELSGRVLDIGAGDNLLVHLYRKHAKKLNIALDDANQSVGVDVMDWGSDCTLIQNSAQLPFADHSFDTITYIACINHIPERLESLQEIRRLLRPDGKVIVTMIGKVIGKIWHALWWYSEDKHRDVDEHEEMGMDESEIMDLFTKAGYVLKKHERFLYGLNSMYIFVPK
ncbi:MAG: class I SAM-dependent methyltransferase [Legionella sp.]